MTPQQTAEGLSMDDLEAKRLFPTRPDLQEIFVAQRRCPKGQMTDRMKQLTDPQYALKQENARLISELRAAREEGWQDIETAPLNVQGLVWSPDASDRTDCFGTVKEYQDGGRFVTSAWLGYSFTHWRPLPAPPARTASEASS